MVDFKKIFYVGRSETMKSLVDNGKYFKFNTEINRKPMEIFKNRCNVAELW